MKLLYKRLKRHQGKIYEIEEYINDKGYLIGEWKCLAKQYKRRTEK